MEGSCLPASPGLSIVVPCYNESLGLSEFYRRASLAAEAATGSDYEIILVDDGSHDATWDVIASLASDDRRVVGVRLMRNYGHQPAVSAGLTISRGARVLLIDADLQDPPELLSAMMRAMDAGADVVYGQRTVRQGETWFKRSSASLFYRLLSRLTATPIPQDTGDFRLMRRRVVEILTAMPERQRFIRGMVSWIGGRQVALPYEREPRFAGATQYQLGSMIRFAVDAVTSFSTVPLRLASYLGILAAMLSLGLLAYSLIGWMMGQTIAGWTSVITAIALFGATQLLMLGVLGEYLGRLFQEVKARPLFLIDSVIALGTEQSPPPAFTGVASTMQRGIADVLCQPQPMPMP